MMQFSTKAIHSGQKPDEATGAVITPVYLTSTYRQDELDVHKGFEYSRTGNPTRKALENCLASLENGKYGLAFSSGLAAEHAVLSTLNPGDHVVATKNLYGGTYRLFEQVFRKYGLEFSYTGEDVTDYEQAAKPNTRIFWIETPTNPLLRLIDISKVTEIAHRHNIKVVVDNTFATPYFQQPLLLGADLVVHSATKYIGGHSDLIGGAVILNDEEWFGKIKFYQNSVGAIPGPFDSWLMLRGIKTLGVRMKKHEENALHIARILEKHPAVDEVFYPGLPSGTAYPLAVKQMSGFGGMVSFKLRNADQKTVNEFFKKLKIIFLAQSLGGVESLVSYPVTMTHGSIPEEERLSAGITENLVRLSVGIEDVEDLTEDLLQALEGVPGVK